ncbi:MAG: hypothetical protein ABI882_23775, partial [Acidobacteriota bacterium]
LVGTLRNDENGKPVNVARVKLFVTHDPKRPYSIIAQEDGSFMVVVPNEPISIQVNAPGYEVVANANLVSRLEGIIVRSGQLRRITINLRRVSSD